ncbi:MAG: hypothetical protein M1828_007390 [Chrysothrix sp. TS-e1954]|nr:MAG: hypothetical protein M1828_007390 [Chrysothrix sp. TS-e1954]
MASETKEDYKAIAAIAQKRRADAIPEHYLLPPNKLENLPRDLSTVPRESGHFTKHELEIIESDAGTLLKRIHSKTWTAVQVTEAFCKSAAVAQQLTDCLTEILFPSALARAATLDAHLQTHSTPVGPLHGLPISLKDCFITPPHPSSIGIAALANTPTSDADDKTILVHNLLALGAVPYVKTNTPVGMMMMETDNHVWGPCINALHSGCSAGGSSGGEASLLQMRGSPLGIGTDIGGSIRIPAAYCGLYGLKPSYGRFPQFGGKSGIPGQDYILAVNGPMSRDLDALRVYSQASLSGATAASSPWLRDPKCVPLPWRGTPQVQPKGRKLRLAVLTPTHDGIVHVQPPVERALAETRKAIEAAGHEVVDWEPKKHFDMMRMVVGGFQGFGGLAIMNELEKTGEPVFLSMKGYETAAKGGEAVLGPTKYRKMLLTRYDLQKYHLDRWQATADEASGKGPIDGLIMPVSPWAACRKGLTNEGEETMAVVSYTAVWNLLDLACCTFPVTRVDKDKDAKRESFEGWSELDGRVQADYEPDFYHGAPVSLQVVGERLGEEKCLEVVGTVKEALEKADVRFS